MPNYGLISYIEQSKYLNFWKRTNLEMAGFEPTTFELPYQIWAKRLTYSTSKALNCLLTANTDRFVKNALKSLDQ